MLGNLNSSVFRNFGSQHQESYSTRNWNSNQHAYLQALREGPTAALDRFRTLFFRRETGPLSGNEEIVKLSYPLCKYYEEFPVENDELWRASADTEFIVFIIDVITGPDFLDHHPQFSSNMCGPLMELFKTWLIDVQSRREPRIMSSDLHGTIWGSIESIWTSMWDRRSSLAQRCDSDAAWRRVAIAFDLIARATEDLRRAAHPGVRSSPDVVRAVYYSWIWSHGAPSLTEADIAIQPSFHDAPTLLYDYYISLSLDGDVPKPDLSESHTFMQELQDALDPKTFVRAALNVLAYSSKFGDTSLISFLRILSLQMHIIGLHCYAAAPLLSAIDTALARQNTIGSGNDVLQSMTAYGAAFEHIRNMISGLVLGDISVAAFPGDRFWNILVGGLPSAYSADSWLRHEQGFCQCGDHAILTEGLAEFLDSLSGLTDTLISDVEGERLPQSAIDEVRDAGVSPRTQANGIWYDVLLSLRRTARHNPTWTTYTTLLDLWGKLGKALGIDEASQRDIEAAHRARQCWWPSCPAHLRPSEKPLLVCKGCKEARYCSAACQRSDWKQGGHRAECRRVK
ncbi:unnamed protein product [Peniophora sp. CBMAI 1063]|nr:unnamed protein product [Peniophora sp. CBMAI 1063]